MATATADPAAEPVDVAQAPVPDPQPKRKWQTFTMSEEAYDTLTATSEALGTNRNRLIEDLILREHRTVTLSDNACNAYELLSNSAEAFATNPERLAEELVNCYCAILARPNVRARETGPLVDVLAQERCRAFVLDPCAGSGITHGKEIWQRPGLRIAASSCCCSTIVSGANWSAKWMSASPSPSACTPVCAIS